MIPDKVPDIVSFEQILQVLSYECLVQNNI